MHVQELNGVESLTTTVALETGDHVDARGAIHVLGRVGRVALGLRVEDLAEVRRAAGPAGLRPLNPTRVRLMGHRPSFR